MPLQIRRAGVTRFKFAVPIVGDMRNLRYRRCGNVPLQIRRSECRRYMQPPLSAMRQCAASNSPFRMSAICVTSVTGGAAMCRFKFAVPIVSDMRNLRFRRLQYDNADSEFGDLKKRI